MSLSPPQWLQHPHITLGSSLLMVVLLTYILSPLRQLGVYMPLVNADAAVADEEFVGPFPSWTNLKTVYGAVGDGIADDTTVFQTALNDLGTSGHGSVLYVPAGTYKITATLTLAARIYVSIIGEDPATTKIVWGAAPPVTDTTLQFTMPGTPGQYEFRLFRRNTYNRAATSNHVAVGVATDNVQGDPDVVAAPAVVNPGDTVAVTVHHSPGYFDDWVALFAVGESDDHAFLAWHYTDTTLQFTMPGTPGQYEFRLFANNIFTRVVTSNHVAVGVATDNVQGAPDLVAAPTVVNPGDTVTVTVHETPGYFDDWVGLYAVGEPDDHAFLNWYYVGRAAIPLMMRLNGVAYSRITRLTFDGQTLADRGVDQSWTGAGNYFDTGNEYADDVFLDVGSGIRGGMIGHGFAETTVIRSKFLQNFQTGIIMGNFNALDLYVWYSTFENCTTGITNSPGAGNYRVYNSLFKNSSHADLEIGNTGAFSARTNTSIGSRTFLTAAGSVGPAEINVQGNTIIDSLDVGAITIANQGPLLLVDNIFRSQAGQTAGPVVSHTNIVDSDTIAIGNTFTVTTPIQTGTGARLITIDNTTVPYGSLTVIEPDMPVTPLPQGRTIFEIPPGANTATIQNTINTAALATSVRPVVHVPEGTYAISTTIAIPASSDLQLIGDTYGTSIFQWTGAGNGPVLHFSGPSKTTVRDLLVHGNSLADGIMLDTIDQQGARVFLSQIELREGSQTHLLVNGLDYTKVDVRNLGSASLLSGVSVKVTGGFQAGNGTPVGGRTDIFCGASASNPMSYDVTNGGQLLVRDMWYETSNSLPAFIALGSTTGFFTLEGSRIALPANQSPPAIVVNGFRGNAVFMTSDLDDRITITGDGSQGKVLGLGMVGKPSPYFINTSSPAARAELWNSRQAVTNIPGVGSIPVANQGTLDPVFIKAMLVPTRTASAAMLADLPLGVSDIRFFRVWVTRAVVGIHLLPGNPIPPLAVPTNLRRIP